MKKHKVSFTKHPDKIFEMIVIRNNNELLEYAELKKNQLMIAATDILTDMQYGEKSALEKDTDTPEKKLIKMFHESLPLPDAVDQALYKVIMGMNKALSIGVLFVNDAGGYNITSEGDFIIREEAMDSYPNIKKGVNSKYLVIENSLTLSKELSDLLKKEGIETFSKITALKIVPIHILKRELAIMIASGLEEIIFESQLVDITQIEEMTALLNSLPPLTIRVLTSTPEKLPQTNHNLITYRY